MNWVIILLTMLFSFVFPVVFGVAIGKTIRILYERRRKLTSLDGLLIGLTIGMTACLILTVAVDLLFSALGLFFSVCYSIALAVWLPKTKKRKES